MQLAIILMICIIVNIIHRCIIYFPDYTNYIYVFLDFKIL